MRIKVVGLNEFTAAVQEMAKELDVAGKAVVVESAALVERVAKGNFSGSHKRGQPHVGGDKPNVVTGNLRRSITHAPVKRYGLGAWGTTVGPTAVYGRRVELGYPGGHGRGQARTRPFPYFAPAVRDSQARMLAIAVRRWGQARP